MEDNMITKLFLGRSESGISELKGKYGKLARTVCMNILNNSADAEECVNDALLSVWNSIPPKCPDSIKAFFIDIVRNKALDRYRYNTSARRNSSHDIALYELEECFQLDGSPENELLVKDLSSSINHFLEGLQKTDRIIFVCRYYYSDSVQSIAEKLDMKESAVSVRLYRIRKKLRSYLQKEDQI